MKDKLLLPSRTESCTYGSYWLCPDCNTFRSTDSPCCKSDPSIAEVDAANQQWEGPSGKFYWFDDQGEIWYVNFGQKAVVA